MAPAKDNFDGAMGHRLGLPRRDAGGQGRATTIVARRANLHYTPGSDPYGFAAVICIQIQTLANAI